MAAAMRCSSRANSSSAEPAAVQTPQCAAASRSAWRSPISADTWTAAARKPQAAPRITILPALNDTTRCIPATPFRTERRPGSRTRQARE